MVAVKEVEKPARPVAGIDLGQKILAAAATEHGKALLYRGGALKADYCYFERRISNVDRMLAKAEEADKAVLKEERRRLFEKRKRRRDQIYANLAKHIAEEFQRLGINVVFVGHPRNIAQEKPGRCNTNMWGYRKLLQRLATTFENYGIAAFAVDEHNSSKQCVLCGAPAKRVTRGLLRCPRGHIAHADINAALNIMKRGLQALGIEATAPQQIHTESFVAAPDRVTPIAP